MNLGIYKANGEHLYSRSVDTESAKRHFKKAFADALDQFGGAVEVRIIEESSPAVLLRMTSELTSISRIIQDCGLNIDDIFAKKDQLRMGKIIMDALTSVAEMEIADELEKGQQAGDDTVLYVLRWMRKWARSVIGPLEPMEGIDE
jgi:hypothetical protein